MGTKNSVTAENPNEVSFLLQNPASFFYLKRDATISTGQTSINVTQYDNNGTLTTMTNNRFKIMTVYKFNSGNHVVQEGQAEYSTLDAAQAAISTRTFVPNPILANGTRLGWILVQKNATSLTNTATSRFIQDNGDAATAVGSAGTIIREFTSTYQTITSGGLLTIPHGLGVVPTRLINCFLRCAIIDNGWIIGDVIPFIPSTTSQPDNRGCVVYYDATNVYVRYGSDTSVFNSLNKSTGAAVALTNINWQFAVTVGA